MPNVCSQDTGFSNFSAGIQVAVSSLAEAYQEECRVLAIKSLRLYRDVKRKFKKAKFEFDKSFSLELPDHILWPNSTG